MGNSRIKYSQNSISSKHLKSRWPICTAIEKIILIQTHFGNARYVPAVIRIVDLKNEGTENKKDIFTKKRI